MKKKLILVAAPPASGKTYVSERLAEALGHTVILDKDDLAPLICAGFAAAGETVDYDGAFYRRALRSAEYETLLHLTFSTLRFEERVMLCAPFGRELRDVKTVASWRERAHAMGAELVMIWVAVPRALRRERMERRASDRDTQKLERWEEYAASICDEPPTALAEAGAVDALLFFDNSDEASFAQSMW